MKARVKEERRGIVSGTSERHLRSWPEADAWRPLPRREAATSYISISMVLYLVRTQALFDIVYHLVRMQGRSGKVLLHFGRPPTVVMRGLVPRIHVFFSPCEQTWMAGTRPAMTIKGVLPAGLCNSALPSEQNARQSSRPVIRLLFQASVGP